MAGGAGHAGDLTPNEAMELLKTKPGTLLIDVRTAPEWDNVGVPDLAAIGSAPIFLEWLSPPSMTPNPTFAEDLLGTLKERGATADTPLLFLCRSGARSTAAANAVTALGYTDCHNVEGGFEGSPGQGLPGWRQAGLPWSRG